MVNFRIFVALCLFLLLGMDCKSQFAGRCGLAYPGGFRKIAESSEKYTPISDTRLNLYIDIVEPEIGLKEPYYFVRTNYQPLGYDYPVKLTIPAREIYNYYDEFKDFILFAGDNSPFFNLKLINAKVVISDRVQTMAKIDKSLKSFLSESNIYTIDNFGNLRKSSSIVSRKPKYESAGLRETKGKMNSNISKSRKAMEIRTKIRNIQSDDRISENTAS